MIKEPTSSVYPESSVMPEIVSKHFMSTGFDDKVALLGLPASSTSSSYSVLEEVDTCPSTDELGAERGRGIESGSVVFEDPRASENAGSSVTARVVDTYRSMSDEDASQFTTSGAAGDGDRGTGSTAAGGLAVVVVEGRRSGRRRCSRDLLLRLFFKNLAMRRPRLLRRRRPPDEDPRRRGFSVLRRAAMAVTTIPRSIWRSNPCFSRKLTKVEEQNCEICFSREKNERIACVYARALLLTRARATLAGRTMDVRMRTRHRDALNCTYVHARARED